MRSSGAGRDKTQSRGRMVPGLGLAIVRELVVGMEAASRLQARLVTELRSL